MYKRQRQVENQLSNSGKQVSPFPTDIKNYLISDISRFCASVKNQPLDWFLCFQDFHTALKRTLELGVSEDFDTA